MKYHHAHSSPLLHWSADGAVGRPVPPLAGCGAVVRLLALGTPQRPWKAQSVSVKECGCRDTSVVMMSNDCSSKDPGLIPFIHMVVVYSHLHNSSSRGYTALFWCPQETCVHGKQTLKRQNAHTQNKNQSLFKMKEIHIKHRWAEAGQALQW